ncbi:MAG: amidophosphoribosyltransferase [Oscillospiraceae bacterium]|jgi:amidophosphoribosyltransferase|nr:amidophosphoribosyltransferase [Oscillospiraceae bacterium]
MRDYPEKPRDECGVVGIICNTDAAKGGLSAEEQARINTRASVSAYHALYALQHRGQNSAGIAVSNGSVIRNVKGAGLAPDVFTMKTLSELSGYMAIGHVRYAGHKTAAEINAQPFLIETMGEQIALAFNGALVNSEQLRRVIEHRGGIFQTASDAEVILNTIVYERLHTRTLEDAVLRAAKQFQGAFSILLMTKSKMIALRDPFGFRPLCVGRNVDGLVIASESCALDAVEASFGRDIRPGEMVVVEAGRLSSYQASIPERGALCAFEFIYMARPDSVIDGQPVETSRNLAGRYLAKSSPADADIVIGVPDSGMSAALGYAQESGIPYAIGFIKNRYIGRTFIQDTQGMRESSLKIKLNVLKPVVDGKRVVMVDDSIVRGTTIHRVVRLLREAGATEVHMRVASPKYEHPCYFGTDVLTRDQLMATRYNAEELVRRIDVDSLGFLRQEDLPNVMPDLKVGWCDACFTGEYPIPIVAEKERNKNGRQKDERIV